MALLVKNRVVSSVAGTSHQGYAVIQQWTHVTCPARVVPQSTTDIIFRVYGGRVLVHRLLGEVTVVISGTDPQISILSKALNAAGDTAIGTAVTVASSATIANLEVGGSVWPEGDATAIIKSNAGAVAVAGTWQQWIAPRGEIYLNAAASSTTGSMKWDIWYQPLDEGAFVVGQGVAAVVI